MRKLVSLLLAVMLVLSGMAAFAQEGGYELALVTDVGNIDDQSFNQGAWEGVVAFGKENGVEYAYYRPSEDSTEARIESMKAAIDKGAKTIVLPGYLFEDALYEMQEQYPEVNFLLLDGEPHSADYAEYKTTANTHCILYREEQAGYLAGYAAVKDGYTKLGFLGGIAVPAVVRYGYGFVQGADDAAAELDKEIEIKYWYCDSFSPSDDIKTKMNGWYTEGTEVVFSCGGGIYLSAVAAANEAGAKVIGVDTDQGHVDPCVISSAMKDLTNSVKLSLTDLYANNGTWPESYAGKTATLGAAEGCVGLPTTQEHWRFNTFTQEEYNALFEKVKTGEIEISKATDVAPEVVKSVVDYQN